MYNAMFIDKVTKVAVQSHRKAKSVECEKAIQEDSSFDYESAYPLRDLVENIYKFHPEEYGQIIKYLIRKAVDAGIDLNDEFSFDEYKRDYDAGELENPEKIEMIQHISWRVLW